MIRVLLVEDQEIVRRGLKTLLGTKPDLQIVGEADNGQSAIEQLEAWQAVSQLPDVVVMDIRMPVMDGVEATRLICQQFAGTKILVLTTFNDTQYVSEALRFGAKGYLLKDTPAEELAKAIRSIHQGYTQFGPGILERAIAQVSAIESEKPKDPPPELLELTAREREVLRLIAAGASNREIAQALFLSEGTVRNHISHILARLNVRDRTQAALVANTFLDWLEKPKTSG
ncbi:response regulator containing a CheY-like receiver domain and an HTH DNA-binding domain [Pleurocapsa sp. PCC 7327]|uniref:response regulator transcription factor n=1 Tax=Pleurocapsa sp. PCC 7327 TaxID=118163 RepID=UPI00029FF303|nr:response regulator transcription factor [Pleurocapsa sp. PCC 7327]AFY78376.1 response regulator containing a CheY-like receiver domain and an HTH DNA-binding domain [Pleurocapsa sp. PCC 7327]